MISIHQMLRFSKFYRLIIPRFEDFNTSNVKVQPAIRDLPIGFHYHFNTSNVKVQLLRKDYNSSDIFGFQYIKC